MKKTFVYRAKINRSTEAKAKLWLNICRTLYNLALWQRISVYRQYKKSISCYAQMRELPELKKAYLEFKVVGSQCLQDVLQRVDRAFQGFFQRVKSKKGKPPHQRFWCGGKAGFPRFKSRNRYHSFTLKQAGWRLEARYLYIKNLGRFKLFLSRPIQGEIKTVTIRSTASGKWFVAFSCDKVAVKEFPQASAKVGIDMGVSSFCVDSTGKEVENPKYFRHSEKLLARRQKRLSRKKKGSQRRNKARILVAKVHERITNQRKDFLHKLANYYIESFDTIYVEDLNIRSMVRNRYLAKSIADSSWSMFFNFLSYKAEEAGRKVVKVPCRNTSQNCSVCGKVVVKSLSSRIHRCPFCGLVLDRDYNASLNILRVGQALQGEETLASSVN